MKKDLYGIETQRTIGGQHYRYANLLSLAKKYPQIQHFPYSIRVLLENVLHHVDGFAVTREHVESLLNWQKTQGQATVPFSPGRVLMQDFTGVPAVVDMASLRDEVARKGQAAGNINPLVPVDIVIDHSVQVEYFGNPEAYARNVASEYRKNTERYQLLKWAQKAFDNVKVVPPGMGICHQINLEYLSQGVLVRNGYLLADTLVGTDSHTPMVNALGVLGWGVGGIEAEAAMLGQPLYMCLPEVVGLHLSGQLPEGTTATDLVLHITYVLRKKGVVGKFVEVFGAGLDSLGVPDRATISNMSPEFGCTDTHWPIDAMTLTYLRKTNRSKQADILEQYAKANLLWRNPQDKINYTEVVDINLSDIESTLSGPKRPQDKVPLKSAKEQVISLLQKEYKRHYVPVSKRKDNVDANTLHSVTVADKKETYLLSDAYVVMAAITSCTNTSNPSVMVGAGLLAKKAVERKLQTKPWVKTSLAPGSRVVTDYLQRAALLPYLEQLGFYVVGYGCTTCIGNSGDMPPPIQEAVNTANMIVAAVLSGNRNFEARIHPQVRMNFLASPILVVAYAIAGRMDIDMYNEPLGHDASGQPVYLKDIWPTQLEIATCLEEVLSEQSFKKTYDTIFLGDEAWHKLPVPTGERYVWNKSSTYVREVPFFENMSVKAPPIAAITDARVLLLLGDMITTDHISPAGKFGVEHPAGVYLQDKKVAVYDFNSYGARRGNHEVMVRGTFANVRIRNKLVSKEGGFTKHFPSGEEMTIFDAAARYRKTQTPLVVIGGKEYGSGSSRDWAAKGTFLLGVRAVIAESFERIHRSNLVGMGVLPIEFVSDNAHSLGLTGTEVFNIDGLQALTPGKIVDIRALSADGKTNTFRGRLRLDADIDILYYKHGGILQYVLRKSLTTA